MPKIETGRLCGYLTVIGKESRRSKNDQHKEMAAVRLWSRALFLEQADEKCSSIVRSEKLRIIILQDVIRDDHMQIITHESENC